MCQRMTEYENNDFYTAQRNNGKTYCYTFYYFFSARGKPQITETTVTETADIEELEYDKLCTAVN